MRATGAVEMKELLRNAKLLVFFHPLKPHRGFKQPNSLDLTFRTGLPFGKDAGFALQTPHHD
jgi:hypothetical protein